MTLIKIALVVIALGTITIFVCKGVGYKLPPAPEYVPKFETERAK